MGADAFSFVDGGRRAGTPAAPAALDGSPGARAGITGAPGWSRVLAARPAGPPIPRPKRAFDVVLSLLALLVLWPVILLVAALLLVIEGRPIIYVAERMAAPGKSFFQLKFRTMPLGADAAGGVTGGHKTRAMSPLHRALRASRLDEVPQLWNVLRGDMSLVGPRPPLRLYVEAYPDLYARVLRSRPGITGLATLRFHAREEAILARCRTPEETDSAYRRACIRQKARLDLVYQRRRTLALDAFLVARTAQKLLRHALPARIRRS